MKKENNDKSKDLFDAFLPDHVKDDPNENLKKEKKLYSIIFIIVCTLLLVANLITMIINFTISLQGGFSSLFVGFINCAISIFLLGLLIVIAHNISKMTRATMFMCNKLLRDEKRLIEQEKQKQKKKSNDKEDYKDNDDNITDDAQDDDESDTITVETEVVVD